MNAWRSLWRRFGGTSRPRRRRAATGAVGRLAKSTTSMPLTVDHRGLGGRRRDVRLTQPGLAHDYSPSAPEGLVLGVARAVKPRRRGFALVFRERGRRRPPPPAGPTVEKGDSAVAGEAAAVDAEESTTEPVPGHHRRPIEREPVQRRQPLDARATDDADAVSDTGATRDASTFGRSTNLLSDAPDAATALPLVGERGVASGTTTDDSIPASVRSRIGRRFGVDLSRVAVRRGPAAADIAARINARAFAWGDEIHVPDRHGPFGSTHADALAAHELTHIAQRRRHGPHLPSEDSPVGRILEVQARHEEALRSGPYVGEERSRTPSSPGVEVARGATRPPFPSAPALLPDARRAPADGGGDVPSREAPAEDVFDQLYERIRGRLRHELIVDRERAGLLSDVD